MSKTDGIGTWVWNDYPSFDGSFTVNFISNNQSFSSISGDSERERIYYNDTLVFRSEWVAAGSIVSFRSFDIKTAPTADFLTILQANATYQEPKLTDLTGTTWKWNETLTAESSDVDYTLAFSSHNQNFYKLSFVADNPFTGDTFGLRYLTDVELAIDVDAYNTDGGWVDGGINSLYRLISITGGTDATNTDLINYLYANAELQGSAPSEPTYKLRINGTYARVNGKTKGSLTFGGATYKWDNTSVIGGGVTPEPTDELLGTWYFDTLANDLVLQIYYGDVSETDVVATSNRVSFVSSGTSYTYLNYADSFLVSSNRNVFARGKWFSEDYRTITITDTSTLTNRDEFTTWLKAKAVKQ